MLWKTPTLGHRLGGISKQGKQHRPRPLAAVVGCNILVGLAQVAMSQDEPVRITFFRSRLEPRAFLVYTNLDIHSLEELRHWAARKVDFIVLDESTGHDVTRVLLA